MRKVIYFSLPKKTPNVSFVRKDFALCNRNLKSYKLKTKQNKTKQLFFVNIVFYLSALYHCCWNYANVAIVLFYSVTLFKLKMGCTVSDVVLTTQTSAEPWRHLTPVTEMPVCDVKEALCAVGSEFKSIKPASLILRFDNVVRQNIPWCEGESITLT